MIERYVKKLHPIVFIALFLAANVIGFAQPTPAVHSQEVSEIDGIPVLIKHLPEGAKRFDTPVFANNLTALQVAAGDRRLLDVIDFAGGTEAATANYDAGRLVIVEFTTPQASVDADARINAQIGAETAVVYRRIGNYNAFVFDVTDEAAANSLLDQVKYEKDIRWLYGEPVKATKAERDFTIAAASLFLSTFVAIMVGIGFAMCVGAIVGVFFFRYREGVRASMPTFSDAGGMVRLNLDGLTPDSFINE